jgi:hypothetical protein
VEVNPATKRLATQVNRAKAALVLVGLGKFWAYALIGIQHAENVIRVVQFENIPFHKLPAALIQFSSRIITKGIDPARHAAAANPPGLVVQVPGSRVARAEAQAAIYKEILAHACLKRD